MIRRQLKSVTSIKDGKYLCIIDNLTKRMMKRRDFFSSPKQKASGRQFKVWVVI